jgi:hypothetical protein
MKADNEDNGKALKSLGLAKEANEVSYSERSLDGANGSRECVPDDERNCARAVMTGSAKSGRSYLPGSSVAAPAAYRQECVRPS